MFESRDFEKIGKVINDVGSAIYFNQDLLTVWFLMEVYLLENKTGVDILANIPITDGVFVYLERKWMILRLLLIRMIFDYSRAEEITKLIAEGEYSIVAVIIAALHNIPSENFNVLDVIGRKLGEEYGIGEDIWNGAILLVKGWEKAHQPSAEGL